ncbi:MAG: tetratricopeptide repeat protein, partial [Candidatus Obscuribacterales bacterium]|nr:tetratricopeptide repeat protein [Candidatus Obscuribacterales bacterium]
DKARELFAQTVNELKGNDSVDAMLALATANTSLGKLDLNSGNYQLAIEEYKNSQKYWKEYDGDKTADYVDVTADLAKAYKQAGQLSNASKTYKWLLDQPYPSSVSEIRQELANQYANILWAEGRFKNVPNLAAQLSDPEKYKKLIGKSTAH